MFQIKFHKIFFIQMWKLWTSLYTSHTAWVIELLMTQVVCHTDRDFYLQFIIHMKKILTKSYKYIIISMRSWVLRWEVKKSKEFSWALDISSREHFCVQSLPKLLVTLWPHIHNPMMSLPLVLALHQLHRWVVHQNRPDMRHSHLIHIQHRSYFHLWIRYRVLLLYT